MSGTISPVLADRDHQIVVAECDLRHRLAIDHLRPDGWRNRLPDLFEQCLLFRVRNLDRFEPLAGLLQVEPRLRLGIEARDKIVEFGLRSSSSTSVFISDSRILRSSSTADLRRS